MEEQKQIEEIQEPVEQEEYLDLTEEPKSTGFEMPELNWAFEDVIDFESLRF